MATSNIFQENQMRATTYEEVIQVLTDAGYDVHRVSDAFSFAIPGGEIAGKTRWVSFKMTLKKKDFDIEAAEFDYKDIMRQRAEKEEEAKKKKEENARKRKERELAREQKRKENEEKRKSFEE